MDLSGVSSLLVAMGVGGAVGAAAALVLAGNRVALAFGVFGRLFQAYVRDRPEPAAETLRAAFDDLESALRGFTTAAERLGRALRRR